LEQYQVVVAVVAGALTFLTFGNKIWAGWLKLWRYLFGAPHEVIQDTIDERCEEFREEVVKIYSSQEELNSRIEEVSIRQEEKIVVMDSMIEAQRAILRDRLFQACEHYIERGEITVAGLENITSLHEAYNDVKGNGTGDKLYAHASQLKIRTIKEFSNE